MRVEGSLYAVAIFKDMRMRELRLLNEIDHDPERQQLNERFATDVFDLPAGFASADGPFGLLLSPCQVGTRAVSHWWKSTASSVLQIVKSSRT